PRSRYPQLFAQWPKEGRLAALTDAIDDAQDPTKQLDGIIAATRDPQMQAQLAQINEALKRTVSLIAGQREEAAGSLMQAAARLAEAINNYSIRVTNLKKDRGKAGAARDQATGQLHA
ncbi:type VI secretion protein, partial [Pseudomonas aeruginosa]|nr:type VI secretion protein [Pseudomonas aeruginosa]